LLFCEKGGGRCLSTAIDLACYYYGCLVSDDAHDFPRRYRRRRHPLSRRLLVGFCSEGTRKLFEINHKRSPHSHFDGDGEMAISLIIVLLAVDIAPNSMYGQH